jgi:ABC-type spermidine/putrescine transport system permease subunit I
MTVLRSLAESHIPSVCCIVLNHLFCYFPTDTSGESRDIACIIIVISIITIGIAGFATFYILHNILS